MPPRWQWLAGHSEGHAQACDQVVLIVSLVHAAIDSRGAFPIQPSHTGSSHVQSDSSQCAGRSRTLGRVAGITDVLACTQFGPFTSAGSPLNAFSKLAGCCGTAAKPAGHPPISRELMSSVVPCPLSRPLPHPAIPEHLLSNCSSTARERKTAVRNSEQLSWLVGWMTVGLAVGSCCRLQPRARWYARCYRARVRLARTPPSSPLLQSCDVDARPPPYTCRGGRPSRFRVCLCGALSRLVARGAACYRSAPRAMVCQKSFWPPPGI